METPKPDARKLPMNDTLSHPARADPVNNTDLCDARPSGSRNETRIVYKGGRQLGTSSARS